MKISFFHFHKYCAFSIQQGIVGMAFFILLSAFPFKSFSQTVPISGDQFHLYGPNTSWGQYLKIGGNGRNTTHASVVTTNGDLHLDSKDGSLLYLNHYSKSNTIINSQGGNLGIGTSSPEAKLHINGQWNDLFKMGNLSNVDGGQLFSTHEEDSPVLNFGELDDPFLFRFFQTAYSSNLLLSFHKGMMGIGVTRPDALLTVNGQIHAKGLKVDVISDMVPDFVFEDNYLLMSLEEIEIFVKRYKHLPGIPSALEMEQNGMELKEMSLLLLQKVEEMTLHMIEMNKQISQQEGMTHELRNKVFPLSN